jgi:hypothetical protein
VILIYDNACKLFEYWLNRLPHDSTIPQLYTDSFHHGCARWPGGHKCGISFNVKGQWGLNWVKTSIVEASNVSCL